MTNDTATPTGKLAGQHAGNIFLMITDVIMPGMNGRELAEQMAVLRPAMKVLYISGYAESTVYRKGVLEPGAQFLQTPFGPPDLGRKVRDVLGAQREVEALRGVSSLPNPKPTERPPAAVSQLSGSRRFS